MELKNISIFSPLILIGVIFFYVLFALICTTYYIGGLSPVKLLTYLYIIYGTLIFLVGYLSARLIEKYYFKKNIGDKNAKDVLKSFLDIMENNRRFTENGVRNWVLLALFLQLINLIFLGGIPLFSGYLKAVANNN